MTNTAKNPTTEIFYGSGFSKYIFKVDFTDLINKINDGEYVIDENTTHRLKMTNTIFGDETFLGAERGTGRQRATSFDLIVFKIDEYWDEGVGFDYENNPYDLTIGNKTYDTRPSNWSNRTNLNQWTVNGIYADNPDIIDTIHFDNGNENLDVDITNYVNDIIVSGNTNFGLGIAFSVDYQNFTVEIDQSVSFFTKYTQTFFEPFVESYFDDIIDDNRSDFVSEIDQNLYLYVTKSTNPHDLDSLPSVDIFDGAGQIITGFTDLPVTKVKKGVYKVTLGLAGIVCDGKKFFTDVWKNISIDGVFGGGISQKFIPKPFLSKYTLGPNQTDTVRYKIQFSGIKQNEKVIRGDVRKLVVNIKNITTTKVELFDEVFYRMFIMEGRTNVIIHDWTQIDKTNENSFFLNTEVYIPREYFIEIKAKRHSEEIFYENQVKFEIVSEK